MITLNEVQLATNLAHMIAMIELKNSGAIKHEDDMSIDAEDGDGTVYTETAQNEFDHWYDKVHDMIMQSANELKNTFAGTNTIDENHKQIPLGSFSLRTLRELIMRATREQVEELVEEKAMAESWKEQEQDNTFPLTFDNALKFGVNIFARKCDISGEPMNEGYFIEDWHMYIKTEENMLKHLLDETDYKSIEDAVNSGYCYYTEWEEIDEDEYYNEKGEKFVKNNEGEWEADKSREDQEIFVVMKDIKNNPDNKDKYGQVHISYFSETVMKNSLTAEAFERLKSGKCPHGKLELYGNRHQTYYAVGLTDHFYKRMREDSITAKRVIQNEIEDIFMINDNGREHTLKFPRSMDMNEDNALQHYKDMMK